MYSRNQSRNYNDEEYEDDEFSEEYELFAYNLPPNYDGSRFRKPKHQSHPRRKSEITPINTQNTSVTQISNETPPTTKGVSNTALCDRLGIKLGSEELLIIALILILAAENDRTDTLLLLAILLAVE